MTVFSKRERIEAFKCEWEMRESLLFFRGASKKSIADHRKEILHRYQLTEEEIAVDEDDG